MPSPEVEARGKRERGRERSSRQWVTDAAVPPSKRSRSVSPTKVDLSTLPNPVHRRVVLRDYGQPIYNASSRAVLLTALEGCIQGHESLYRAGILHRDISTNNLMINEDASNPSWPSFLIDLDLAIKTQRQGVSGAKGMTGTKAFMATGALLGERRSFMHDLESFFWVFLWICIHYDGPGKDVGQTEFEMWNYMSVEDLATREKGQVTHEGDFIERVESAFTPYFQPLVPWVNQLRRVVFPNSGRWEREDEALYSRMREVLRQAREDPNV
ncbi:hypothetical protein GGS23DRAFT_607519 [Durotheca rogersii]|uniref:uncharacterized protein n=1 Tax=Durotheca rogersii TaxID=419775 RepID=UPI00221E7E98|nr:uncharacterized protein GGS23DRAFT_607519 [Durotheca rogersii]KAI5859479.1 hypothetical protein GGS23DRAFT_607519 [Durotheca rogersii]